MLLAVAKFAADCIAVVLGFIDCTVSGSFGDGLRIEADSACLVLSCIIHGNRGLFLSVSHLYLLL